MPGGQRQIGHGVVQRMEDHHRPQRIGRQVNVAEHQADDRGVDHLHGLAVEHAEEKRRDEPCGRHAELTAQRPQHDAAADQLLEDRSEDHQRKDGPESAAHFERQFGHQPQQRFEHHADGEHQHEGPQQQRGIQPPGRETRPRTAAAARAAVVEDAGKRDRHRAEIERRHHLAQRSRLQRFEIEPVPGEKQEDHRCGPHDDLRPEGDTQHGEQVAHGREFPAARTQLRRRDCGRLSRSCGLRRGSRRFFFFHSIV